MHNHSEKIEPKKLAITIIFATLLFGYAYITRDNRNDAKKTVQEPSATSTLITNSNN